jgi:serine/threonine-protein kinase
MNAEKWKKVEAIFESAIERDPAERAAYLDEACGRDSALRREVESLLAHQQPTGRFMPTLVQEAAKIVAREGSIAPGDSRFIPGTVLAGRYRLVGPLGKGGMGEVYRADDLKLSQVVALKFLPVSLEKDRAMLERFHREVRIARQISHPNICRVYDIGEVDGQHFLSMEYVDGEDLASLLRRIGRLPSDKAVEIAGQLCAGLAAAHEQGVLHRDLKPANVMIDGRGKARIMDFGLAGLADEFEGQEVRAGTPAYMAPEQLAGREVTERSDIYSLGLVLYEIFTGKKAFEASSLEELIRQHESSTPPSISDYVKEIDPLVERVILRCLERDSTSRPATAAQVAAALPGGDPLAAAIAAGETPSPEMVAAAPKEGALRPAVAVACLIATLGLLGLIVALSGKMMMQNNTGMTKSPEVLAERAATIAAGLGYGSSPADIAYGLEQKPGTWDRVRDGKGLDDSISFKGVEHLLIYFWYRQSPRYLEPFTRNKVSLSDPPSDVANMASVILDPQGRLLRFEGVPPQIAGAGVESPPPDWSSLFTEAGFDLAAFSTAEPKWVPAVAFDNRAAWEGSYPGHEHIPIRVEAASFQGKAVYFHVIPPWERPLRQEEFYYSAGRRAAGVLLAIVFFASLIGAVLIARRNLQLGRGDRKGAYKLAMFVFLATMIGQLLWSDHVPTLGGELAVWFEGVAWALFISAFIWFLYMALEPFVRRRWPNLIISWSRLIAGDFRDPMVGRDILIGGMLGFCHTLAIYLVTWIRMLYEGSGLLNTGVDLERFGIKMLLAKLLSSSLVESILMGFGYLFLLLLFYALLRKELLAAWAIWLTMGSINYLAFLATGPPVLVIGSVIITTAYTIAVWRYGLLATISLHFYFTLTFHYPITPELSSWFAGTTIFSTVIIAALAIYGFYISLAGQPVFRGSMLRD